MSGARFDLVGRVAVVTGGYGVLGGAFAADLGEAGAKVAILGRRREAAEAQAERIRAAGGQAIPLVADVLDETALRTARDEVLERWGSIDILINAAGGNVARSRTDVLTVFEIPVDAFEEVLQLNLHGTVVPTVVFGEAMAARGKGSIINISSMASLRVISGVMGYSAAKAAVDNFTRWIALAVIRRREVPYGF